MRTDLLTHPKIVRILSATKSDKFRTIGGLHSVWSVFDTHSDDGRLEGYTPDLMDQIIGWPGFSAAMLAVDWLVFEDDGVTQALVLPEFDEHNSASAKRRADDAKRKRDERKSANSRTNVQDDADKNGTDCRLEKEKEKDKSKDMSMSAGADASGSLFGGEGGEDEGTERVPGSGVKVPYADIVAAYHDAMPMLPRVRDITEARKRKMKTAWLARASRQSVGAWAKYFAHAAKSDFLTNGANGWRASFDFLIEGSNIVKVMEGNYDNKDIQE